MSRHLCISVTFLDCLFHGKGIRKEPEWPPSPLRLFQALLAGARAGCRERDWSDAKVDAFRWLEKRNPPEIITPVARQAPGHTLFVPNNDSDKKFERNTRLTSKDARPHRMIGGHTLHYLWPISEEEWPKVESFVDTLRVEARHLLVLGWGIDSIVGNGSILTVPEVGALTGVRWQPWPGLASSRHQRRVPVPGTLNDLRDAYVSFRRRLSGNIYQPPREPRVFDYVTYLKLSAFPPRPHAAFLLDGALSASRRATFRQVDVARVAAMLRRLAVEAAGTDSHEFPGGTERYVMGRTTDRNDGSPRLSYLPLPTTRHKHADGMIRRVVIAEPYGGDGAQVHWAAQRLLRRELVDETGEVRAVLSMSESPDRDTVLGAYTEPAKAWSSITPVILPGFDDGKYEKAKRLLLKALEHADLPTSAIEDAVLRKAPFWSGSQHPRLYHRPDYLQNFSAWHVHLRFKKEISGPLVAGAGRHCGLGLFVSEAQDW